MIHVCTGDKVTLLYVCKSTLKHIIYIYDGGSIFNVKAFSYESSQVWLFYNLTVLLSSYLYLNVFTTMCFLFISIQSTIACTPCAAALAPSELPCRIQSVR